VKFKQEWREFSQSMDDYFIQALTNLTEYAGKGLEQLNKYIDENHKKISDYVDFMSSSRVINELGNLPNDASAFSHSLKPNDSMASAEMKAVVGELNAFEAALSPIVRWFERWGRILASFFGTSGADGGGGAGGGDSPQATGGGSESLWNAGKRALGFSTAPAGMSRRAAEGMENYKDVPNAGSLTKLITAEAQRAGIDPRLMEGIRAGESGHTGKYDHNRNRNTGDDSYGPFQLNNLHPGDMGSAFERDTAEERKRLGFGGLEGPRTIPLQARYVANWIKRTGNMKPWAGFHGPREADPRWGDAGYVELPHEEKHAPASWDQGPNWDSFNDSLPTSSTTHNSKSAVVNQTNTIHVTTSDPAAAAGMVGTHLDRTSADISRNTQGAFQ
jgi:hypothetical protein